MNFFKKLLIYICCFFVVIAINFMLPRLMPGDPALIAISQDGVIIDESEINKVRSQMKLDKPIHIQLISYINDIFQGDWGYSYHNNKKVYDLLMENISASLMITLPALVLSSVIAAVFGCVAGYKKESSFDIGTTVGMIVLYAIPTFLLGMLLVYFFGFKLRAFPLGGIHSSRDKSFFDLVRHLFLPITTLTLSSITARYLIVRNTVVKEKNSKYVIFAKAKGVSDYKVLFKHILANACHPFISSVGIGLGFLISGSLVIEVVFSINGMGSVIYNSAITRDYIVLQGTFFLLSLLVIIGNIIADIVSVIIDPRIRKGAYDEN